MNRDLIREPMMRLMIRLSLPAILGMVLFGVNQIVDAVFVGRYVGEAALAGVSVSLPIAQSFLGFGAMIGGGAGALLSIALGKGDTVGAQSIVPNLNGLSIVIAAVTGLATAMLAQPIVVAMGGRGAAVGFGTEYIRIIGFGAFLQIWGLAGNFIIRAEGRLGRAMAYAAVGLLINIALNWLFVVVYGLGVSGAAWATNAGMAMYCLCNVLYFRSSRPSFGGRRFVIRFDRPQAKRVLALGAPAFIFQVMAIVQQFTVYRLIAIHGTIADAALFGAAYRVFFVATLPVVGMMRALQPILGQNYGAGEYQRVRSAVFVFGGTMLGFSIITWALLMVQPEFVFSAILPNRTINPLEIVDLRRFVTVIAFLPIPFLAITYFPAIGSGAAPAALALARQVIVFIPTAILTVRSLGISGIYRTFFWTDVVVGTVAGILLIRHLASLREGNVNESIDRAG